MKTKHLLPIITVFFFAGCGEVVIEELPTPTPFVNETPAAPISNSPTDITDTNDGTVPVAASCSAITQERDNLAEAIKVATEELSQCKSEKEKLEAVVTTAQSSNPDTRLKNVALEYLEKIPQASYSFTPRFCGPIGKVTGTSWYRDFSTQIDQAQIPFKALQRPLKASDFDGVCASEEGKIAIFIGATVKGKSEFHLIKYSFETQQVEEAVLLNGTCDICPENFGKREGPYITLTGKNSGNEKIFHYYYDANIIVEK